MIPRYRSPFGLFPILSAFLGGSANISVEHVEKVYADYYGVPYSVLLPSCRAGICWALEICSTPPMSVACSAYTCTTVLEPIIRSGSRLVGVDIARDSFLMDISSLNPLNYQSIVLSEIYGYTYDLSINRVEGAFAIGIRIVDMAMTVPSSYHFQRLNNRDLAVISFGVGKCLYAGWGGIGFTHDSKLAMEIRKLRTKRLNDESLRLVIKRGLEISCRNLIQEPTLYGLYRRLSDLIRPFHYKRDNINILSQLDFAKGSISKEWFTPTTIIDRYLMLYNLRNTTEYIEKRIALANRYTQNLKNVDNLLLPAVSAHALSHYTIRVNPLMREALRKSLYQMGIETNTLFFLSRIFDTRDFPNAANVAAEVINLPIDVRMSLSDVDWICECLLEAVKEVLEKSCASGKPT